MKNLSTLTESFTESVIREMTRICVAADGLNLSQGFPDFEIDPRLKEAATKAIQDGWNQYAITFGQPVLRNAISRKVSGYNHIDCNPDTDITVTCGATEAMMASLMAIINPGDEIVIFEPYYENYGPDSILSGATPRFVTLKTPDWSFDPVELEAAFTNKTKAIVINTPNNPTGKVFNRVEMECIAELCCKYDCYAVTDEIYEHIVFDGAEHISIASLPGMKDRTITINSVSKTYSVTGWRVGWAIASKEITSRIRKVHDFLTVGAPTPLQHAAAAALELDSDYYSNLHNHYSEARDFLYTVLKENGFNPFLPGGAYYIICDVAQMMSAMGCNTDFEFSRKLIEVTGVASVPGSSFYSNPEDGRTQIRFCFCKKWDTLHAVRERLTKLHHI